MDEKLYKITGPDGSSCHGGHGKWRLNRRRSARGQLVPCKNGIHVCRARDLPIWLCNGVIWEVECSDERIELKDKVVVRWAIPRRRIGVLDDRVLRLFACRCVRETPLARGGTVWDLLTDERSHNAVNVAEQYAVAIAPGEELAAAWGAAWDVARNAAGAAAWAAARAAAGDAAWAAARAAAGDAAWAAARDVAGDAAGAAARAAAWAAARDAAGAAARAAARDAQGRFLLDIFENE